ncbi:MAG: hypothetical protein QM770_16480 [Tepidisphaeraceae bacterium]
MPNDQPSISKDAKAPRTRSDDWVSPPLAYAEPSTGRPLPERPKTVSIVAYLAIAIGYVAFILKGTSLTPFLIDARKINPQYIYPDLTPFEKYSAIGITMFEMALQLMCFVGGIALLKLRPIGRKLLITFAVLGILLVIYQTSYNATHFQRFVELQAGATTQAYDINKLRNDGLMKIGIMTPVLLMWPLIILTVLTRKHVKEAFASAAARRRAEAQTAAR